MSPVLWNELYESMYHHSRRFDGPVYVQKKREWQNQLKPVVDFLMTTQRTTWVRSVEYDGVHEAFLG